MLLCETGTIITSKEKIVTHFLRLYPHLPHEFNATIPPKADTESASVRIT